MVTNRVQKNVPSTKGEHYSQSQARPNFKNTWPKPSHACAGMPVRIANDLRQA